uniref:Acyl-CoA-binding domain-containing protein 4 n=1 Tax=Anthurium amnicola TaxID=1678845 RepID=A0A1D1Z7Q5_9ARAE
MDQPSFLEIPQHAADVAHGKLYVMGGSRNGRYLSDIQVFDFGSLTWSVVKPNQDSSNATKAVNSLEEAVPACAGHSMVNWENRLLIIAGYSKEYSDTVTVWSIDLGTHNCSAVITHGKVPSARGGQSVTLVGSKLIMFGGEDKSKQLLNDLHILDLETMIWDVVEATQKSPAPRFDHTAAVHVDRYLMVFGGSSDSTCFNDLHVLDLQTMEWSEPQTQGDVVTPRAGHAGTAVGETWYIVGGGDNKSGARETLKLNMSKLVWSVATNVQERDPLASEGLSICSTTVNGERLLVAFGGYNGKYHNEVFFLKCKPGYSKQPRIFQSPAAAAAAASVTAAYALANMTDSEKSDALQMESKDINQAPVQTSLQVAVDALTAEKKNLESKLAEVRAENLRIKGNLHEMSISHSELSMELQSVQGQLQAERSRCSKLELQIAEIQRRLESLPSIELELDALRRQKSSWQNDLVDTQKQRSQGLWQRMAGTT